MLNRKQTLTALLIGLSLFSSASNSRSFRHYEAPSNPNDYNVELVGSLARSDTEDSTVTSDFTALSAEIYFDDIDIRDKPLAHAAFLSKKTSLSLFYSKVETDVETFGSVDTSKSSGKGLRLNYISPEDHYILGFTTSSGDLDADEFSSKGIHIGKYINDRSIIKLSYLKSTIESIGNGFTPSEESTDDTATLSYETLIDLSGEQLIYLYASASQSELEAPGFEATNQAYRLTTEVIFNNTTSLFFNLGLDRGDSSLLEGQSGGAGGTHFVTTELTVSAMVSLFKPDDEFLEETALIAISGILRF